MGFPCVSLKFPKCLTITLLVSCFRFMFLPILNHLGLLKKDQHDQQQQQQPECPQENYVLVMDGLSLITVPVHTLTSLIKKRLQVVEFGDFLHRSGGAQECGEGMVCSVCLDALDRTHLIRELCNCSHVFHQHCLDCWVDEGQVTCPLCRSMLFPEKSFTYNHKHHQLNHG